MIARLRARLGALIATSHEGPWARELTHITSKDRNPDYVHRPLRSGNVEGPLEQM